MPSVRDRRKCQPATTPSQPSSPPIDEPLPQRLRPERPVPGPLQTARHAVVSDLQRTWPVSTQIPEPFNNTPRTHPVSHPIVRSNIHEHAHAALQERREVVVRAVAVKIEARDELEVHAPGGDAEVAAHGGVDADRVLHGREAQVALDVAGGGN